MRVSVDEEVAARVERSAVAIRERGDGAGAVAALIRAAELSPAARDRARRLADAAYVAAEVTGDLRGAEALLDDARLAGARRDAPAAIAIAASFVLLAGEGDAVAAGARLQTAIETAGDRGIGPVTAECAVQTAVLASCFGGRPELCESLDPHLRWLAPARWPRQRAGAALASDPARSASAALRRLDQDIDSLTLSLDPAEIVEVASASIFTDRLSGCRPALRRVARDEPGSGATAVITATTLLAHEAYQAGQWSEAERLARAAAVLAEARGYGLLRANARAVSALLAAGQGDTERTQALADELAVWAAPRGVRLLLGAARHACALAALARSDFEAAYRHATAISPAGRLPSHAPHALWVMLDLVEAALRTGRPGEAAAHVRAIQAAGVATISPRLELLAGAAAAAIAPEEQGPGLFERALGTRDAERWPFDLARVQLLYGEQLRRTRCLAQSRGHLAAAHDAFRRLGAATWAERAARELRASGRTRIRSAQKYFDDLTPQELQIALLAATGLSNKEIGSRLYLSHRTVGAHLYRIFPKLGITSRAALRDALPAQAAL